MSDFTGSVQKTPGAWNFELYQSSRSIFSCAAFSIAAGSLPRISSPSALKNAEGVTEQLKEENQLEWVCCMQNIEARAREIIENELIYT